MGLFEYWCDECKKPYKMWKHIEPDPIPSCPHCGTKGKRSLGALLQFKGTGFYETDYKNSEVALPSEDE